MNRHESRRVAMQAVFTANQEPEASADEVMTTIVKTLELQELPAYSKALITGVIENRVELEASLVAKLRSGWTLKRINPIVIAILEVALYEINHSDAVDAKVAVNEALNLCDEFADPKEKAFINGVLANFVKK